MVTSGRVKLGCPQARPSDIPSRKYTLLASAASIALVVASTLSSSAYAQVLPSGGDVMGGSATIGVSGDNLSVQQSSPTAIISWDRFSIGQTNQVHFDNGAGATLNRVRGNVSSQIDGSLTATGSVYLINPSGISVGPTGRIETGGSFIGSTLELSDDEFAKAARGEAYTLKGASTAEIVNAGRIGSLGGDVALIAQSVENSGKITAKNGTAALVAGSEVYVQDRTQDGGRFIVKTGGPNTRVKNTGSIKAAEVELRANGGNVYALAGNRRGIIAATGTTKKGGRIFLTAGDNGTVKVTQRVKAQRVASDGRRHGGEIRVSAKTVNIESTLNASGMRSRGKVPGTMPPPRPDMLDGDSGRIIITGDSIALGSKSRIDVSGATGGLALIGGDYKGGSSVAEKYVAENIKTAKTLTVANGAVVKADGAAAGGRIVLWSDERTAFAGHVSSTSVTGRGGNVEVSGKAVLGFSGTADLRGPQGAGTLLLDPYNLSIVAGSGGDVTASADDSTLGVDKLLGLLAGANVTISTGVGGSQAGNITVATDIAWSQDTVLHLQAAGSILINANMTATGTNAGLKLEHGAGKDYVLAEGVSIKLTGSSSTLEISNRATGVLENYTLIHDANAFKTMNTTGKSALADSIDLTSLGQIGPIGATLTGIVTGLGNVVSNLDFKATGNDQGLFSTINAGALVRNIGFDNVKVDGNTRTSVGTLSGKNNGAIEYVFVKGTVTSSAATLGGLVGTHSGSIKNSYVASNVSGTSAVGGLVGSNTAGTITNSQYKSGEVKGTTQVGGIIGAATEAVLTNVTLLSGTKIIGTDVIVGGLLGSAAKTSITNSVVEAGVIISGSNYAGGLIGSYSGSSIDIREIKNSSSSATLTGTITVGGLVGQSSYLNITDSYVIVPLGSALDATAGIVGTASVGGLVGTFINGTILNSHVTGTGSLLASNGSNVGGLVGNNIGTIDTSYTTINVVNAKFTTTGGLVGNNKVGGGIINSYATGNVSGLQYVGGLVGSNSGTITDSQYKGSEVKGTTNVGGIIGSAQDAILTNVTVLSGTKITGSSGVGGLIGNTITASITDSTVEAGVIISGYGSVGGLIGNYAGSSIDVREIKNSSSSATVTGTSTSVGGLVGQSKYLNITDSYVIVPLGSDLDATAGIVGTSNVGGLVGSFTTGTILNSHVTGTGSVLASIGAGIGGLVGNNTGVIDTSYATINVVNAKNNNTGGLVGINNGAGVIKNSYATGNVSGTTGVGGLVGSNAGTITNSQYKGSEVKGTTQVGGIIGSATDAVLTNITILSGTKIIGTGLSVGGLIGQASKASISDAVVEAGVIISGTGNIGGLIGNYSGSSIDVREIKNSSSSATVTGTSTAVGGLVGQSGYLNITDSSVIVPLGSDLDATAGIVGTGTVGGLVGNFANGTILNSHVTGTGSVLATTGVNIGGLVGNNSGKIDTSYATINVINATNNNAGGLVGINNSGSNIKNSYATGNISGKTSVGGLIGNNAGTITTSQYKGSEVKGTSEVGGIIGITTDAVLTNITILSGTKIIGTGNNVGGLIGKATKATITDAVVEAGVNISGTGSTGGLIGYYTGSSSNVREIKNSSSSATVTGTSTVGGLVGYAAHLKITNSHVIVPLGSTLDATAGIVGTSGVGGLVGNFGSGTILNSYVTGTGNVLALSGLYVGGLVGTNSGTIDTSYATVNVVNAKYGNAGGLVGGNNATGSIKNSYATGNVSGKDSVGGLVGVNSGTIQLSYVGAGVTVTATDDNAGGLVGLFSKGTLQDSYTFANVTSSGNNVGGIAGSIVLGSITRTYSTGQLAGSAQVGGIVGELTGGSITASFWNKTPNPSLASIGLQGAGTSSNLVGLSIADLKDTGIFMQYATSFGGDSWDFQTVWAPPGDGYTAELYALSKVIRVHGDKAVSNAVYGDTKASILVPGSTAYYGAGAYALGGTAYDTGTANTSFGTGNVTLSKVDAGLARTINAGGTNRTAADQGYRIVYTSNIDIAKRDITLTADIDKTYDGWAWTPDLAVLKTTNGTSWVQGDSAATLGDASQVNWGTAATLIDATNGSQTFALSNNGLSNTNYNISFVNGTINIKQRSITVPTGLFAPEDLTRAYDGTYTFNHTLPINSVAGAAGQTVQISISGLAYNQKDADIAGTKVIGNWNIANVIGGKASNYKLVDGSGNIATQFAVDATITKAVVDLSGLTFDADKVYDGQSTIDNVSFNHATGINGETLLITLVDGKYQSIEVGSTTVTGVWQAANGTGKIGNYTFTGTKVAQSANIWAGFQNTPIDPTPSPVNDPTSPLDNNPSPLSENTDRQLREAYGIAGDASFSEVVKVVVTNTTQEASQALHLDNNVPDVTARLAACTLITKNEAGGSNANAFIQGGGNISAGRFLSSSPSLNVDISGMFGTGAGSAPSIITGSVAKTCS